MQLYYRTKAGATFYSQPVYAGDATISFDGGAPANGLIFAVICNTDYVFSEEARTSRFDYKLKLGTGARQAADVNLRWFNWEDTIVDPSLSTDDVFAKVSQFEIYPNPAESSSLLNLKFRYDNQTDYDLKISNISCQAVYTKLNCESDEQIPLSNLSEGLYF
ncbi:T9SS type A sorting domain-containing protein [Tamlana flava]|uniref:T9SS type A sorting domain-containing protein n=1 Tax=Tamlana flava TaxID=3158572 RepID=UPI00351B993C